MLDTHTLFVTDAFVNDDPSAEQLASIALMVSEEVSRFGLPPKAAFLSHSNCGSSQRPSARKMRDAHTLVTKMAPHIESDGELQGDAALSQDIRTASLMESQLKGAVNLLV
jgi:malate dehydrogenase (oxaloacetate-decarboxylating)(NADP+)